MNNNPYKFSEEGHLHSFEGRPLTGCSSVGSVLAKPLTWWASGLAVAELGWTKSMDGKIPVPKEERLKKIAEVFPKIKELSDEEYLALLDKGYRAHNSVLNKSATAGTDRHEIVERYVKWKQFGGEALKVEESESISPYIIWSDANVAKYLWSEAHCYSEKHWLGGISDIGAELKNGHVAIIDIKSSKEAYPNQFFQIGGYDVCVSENGLFDENGNQTAKLDKPITAHIIFPFGMPFPTGIVQYDTKRNIDAFLAELTLYRLLNSFDNQERN